MSIYWSAVRGIIKRNLLGAIRVPALSLQPALGPIVFLVAFGGGLSAFGEIPGFDFPSGYTSFQFVFITLQAGVFNGVFQGVALARDLELGFAHRLMLAIDHRSAMVVAAVIAGLIRSVVILGILFGIGFLAGMQVDGTVLQVFGLISLAMLMSTIGTLYAAGIALRFRTVQSAPLMFMPSFLALFLTPLMVPFDLLSGWIKQVARYNPLTYLLQSGRGFISGQPDGTALAFGLAAASIVVASVWAARSLRRAEGVA